MLRPRKACSPASGTTTFIYNAAGEVIRTDDARGIVVEEFHDALGRIWHRKTGATPSSGDVVFRHGFEDAAIGSGIADSFTYDYNAATGAAYPGLLVEQRRSAAGQNTVYTQFSYDTLGREIGRNLTLDGTNYAEDTIYDSLGRVLKQGLSFGLTVNSQARTYSQREEMYYGARGHLTAICKAPDATSQPSSCNLSQVYWRLGEQDARGNAVKETRHDSIALETRRSFDPLTGRIDTLQSGSATPSLSLQSWNLDFDLAGNLVRRMDLRSGFDETVYYDRLDRMTRINLKGPNLPGQGTDTLLIAFDPIGNICQKTVNGAASPYSYPGRAGCGVGAIPGSSGGSASARPHAVSAAYGKTYLYDAAGNQQMVRLGSTDVRSVDYDAYHRPTELIEGSAFSPASRTSFTYDASNARVKRVDLQGGTTTTRYIGGTERIEGSDAGCTTSGCVRVRRAIGGTLILVSTFTGVVSDPTLDYRYLFADHLGSVEVITDQTGAHSGTQVDRTSFDAHGKRRDPANWQAAVLGPVGTTTKRGFTNHEHVDRLGLVHFGGRLHDPELGRFIQADPFVEDDATQGLNRYTYVLNNPLTLTDPTGYFTGKQMAMIAITVVINIYMPGIVNGMLNAGSATAMPGVLVAGATSGAINGGTEGAVIGAFSAGLFNDIGSGFKNTKNLAGWMKNGKQLSSWGRVAKAVTHGFTGGVLHTMQGGQFGHGFVSAGITESVSPAIEQIDSKLGEAFATAIVGGSVSEVTGGKFAHGALTGAFQWAFNHLQHKDGEQVVLKDGGDISGDDEAEYEFEVSAAQSTEPTSPGHSYLGIRKIGAPESAWDFFGFWPGDSSKGLLMPQRGYLFWANEPVPTLQHYDRYYSIRYRISASQRDAFIAYTGQAKSKAYFAGGYNCTTYAAIGAAAAGAPLPISAPYLISGSIWTPSSMIDWIENEN